MKMISFADGMSVPALGQGTWMMGESLDRRAAEVAALQEGIELGLTLIDTAEMYADGEAERVVGEAIAGRREAVFLVSKAYPQNASGRRLRRACEASLKRLGTDRLDLYLLHWRGNVALAETVEAMEELVAAGLVARWGVSNLDTEDMEDLAAAGGEACAANQILYNLARRGPEFELIPWLERRRIPVMAYSPVEQGRLLGHTVLREVALRHGASAAQVALAWLMTRPGVLPIPKAASIAHVRENRAAVDLVLTQGDLAALEHAFPPPVKRSRLEML
jgi:diketogulonate reductase-like aldo/keto reductase